MKKRYPDHPGHRDSDTSKAAAEAMAAHLGPLQRRCLAAIREAGEKGLTAHETADVVGVDYMSIHPRISELRKKGLVVDSGQRRPNPSAKTAIAWVGASPFEKPNARLPGDNTHLRKADDDSSYIP